MDIKQSKSILAKLLATENLSVQHKLIPTAYFDVKNRVLALPIWKDMSADLYDLLTGHEVGHALFTPPDGWHDSVTDKDFGNHFKGFLNVLEDARIEKLIKRKFPGLAKNFYAGYKDLFDNDFFGIKDEDISELLFIDRINIHFKLGSLIAVPFNAEEVEIVQEIENIETWEQVLALAKRLYAMAKEELESKQMKAQGDMEMQEFDADDAGESQPGEASEEMLSGADIKELIESMIEPESLTDKAFRARENDLLDEKSKPHVYYALPKFDSSKFIWNYRTILNMHNFSDHQESQRNILWAKFREKNLKFVNYLIKEFELKRNAQQMARARISKSGEIDLKKVHNYNFSEDLFLKVTTIPKGKNHGLIMYYDMSGSMSSYMNGVIEQLLILVEFCRKINIPFEVYGFTNDEHVAFNNSYAKSYFNSAKERFQTKNEAVGDINIGDDTFRLQQYFSDQMSSAEYKKMVGNLLIIQKAYQQRYAKALDYDRPFGSFVPPCESLHSTPLNQSIIMSRDIFEKFRMRTKAEVVNMVFLTDGEADRSLRVLANPGAQYGVYDNLMGTINTNVYIKDKTSKIEVKAPQRPHGGGITAALLELARDTTGANIVGFFLTNAVKRSVEQCVSSVDRWIASPNRTQDELIVNKIMETYKRDRVAVVTQAGFNEYYVVHAPSMALEDENLDVSDTADIKDIGKAFKKLHKGKVLNRVLLNRFINMIA